MQEETIIRPKQSLRPFSNLDRLDKTYLTQSTAFGTPTTPKSHFFNLETKKVIPFTRISYKIDVLPSRLTKTTISQTLANSQVINMTPVFRLYQSSDQIYSGFRIFKNGKWIMGKVKSHQQAQREYKLAENRN